MMETNATLLSLEKQPKEEFRGIFALYPSAMGFLLASFMNSFLRYITYLQKEGRS
jgi:hypothetical protein